MATRQEMETFLADHPEAFDATEAIVALYLAIGDDNLTIRDLETAIEMAFHGGFESIAIAMAMVSHAASEVASRASSHKCPCNPSDESS